MSTTVADSNPADNTTKVIVGIGGLPTTGTSLTIAGIAAAALLVAGGALVVFTRRKRAVAGPGEAPEAPGADAVADAGDSPEESGDSGETK